MCAMLFKYFKNIRSLNTLQHAEYSYVCIIYMIRLGMSHVLTRHIHVHLRHLPLEETRGVFIAREKHAMCKVSRREHYITSSISDAAHIHSV